MYKIIILLGLLFTTGAAGAQSNWRLSTEKDGIKVYTRTVADSKINAVKVECTFKATASQFVAVIMDVKNGSEWLYHTKLCTLVKQVSAAELYYYSEVSLPWPAENRDFVAHLTVSQDAETKVVTIDGPAVPGFVPTKKGIIRISNSKGKWLITPAGNQVKVEYTLQVDPGGIIPAWLVNMFASEGPLQSFKGLKLQMQKEAYKKASFSFIRN